MGIEATMIPGNESLSTFDGTGTLGIPEMVMQKLLIYGINLGN